MEMLMDSNSMMMIWNAGLTMLMAILGFVAKEKSNELQRLSILLNITREEIARDNVTNQEVDKLMAHLDQRFNKLESKIDELVSARRYAQ
jgi:hypothetical protein